MVVWKELVGGADISKRWCVVGLGFGKAGVASLGATGQLKGSAVSFVVEEVVE
jgi:hypothetical protein